MKRETTTQLGDYLRHGRETRGWTTRRLAAVVGVDMAQIVRLEQGRVQSPRAELLTAVATQLQLPLADVFGLAGFAVPDELPSFRPYLRAKYGSLPPNAVAELERNFEDIARKYGTTGPRDGEDER